MSFNTETALAFAPGIIFNELDGGGMIIDRNTGEYVEASQILKDPLHLSQLNCLDEGHLGCLKLGFCDDASTHDDADELDDDDEPSDNIPITRFMSEQEELTALIADHEADMAARYTTCTKGRHPVFGVDKTDGGRRYKLLHRGRNTAYKNKRRLQTAW